MPDLAGLRGRILAAVERWNLTTDIRGMRSFALKAGIPPSTFQSYIEEHDPSEPGAAHLARIARTAGVSADWLLFGEATSAPDEQHPRQHIKAIMRELRRAADEEHLPRDLYRRYQDLLFFIGTQMRRLVFDAERFLHELHAHTRRERFDEDEYRRRWLAAEQENDDR